MPREARPRRTHNILPAQAFLPSLEAFPEPRDVLSKGSSSKTGYPGASILERLCWRSLRHGEEALYLAGEAINVGFENRWTLAGRKLAHGIAVAAHRTGEHDFACSASIAHPVGIAAGADEIASSIEIERVHRQRDRLAGLASAYFEDVEVAADQADPDEKCKRMAEDAIEGAGPR